MHGAKIELEKKSASSFSGQSTIETKTNETLFIVHHAFCVRYLLHEQQAAILQSTWLLLTSTQ